MVDSQRTHIMHIRDSSGIYGGERVILGLAQHTDRTRFKVSLLCLDRGDGKGQPLVEAARKEGIPVQVVKVNGRWDGRAISAMRKIFINNSVALIHSHDFKSNLFALMASRGLGLKRVTTAHGSTRETLVKRFYLALDEKVVYRWYDKVITVSGELKNFLLKRGVKSRQLDVVENGLDFSTLQQHGCPKHAALEIPLGKKVFSVVGRLYPDKGHEFFLEAFKRAVAMHPEALALIVGDGPSAEQIARKISLLGLDKAVRLTGARDDMDHVYEKTDFLVISSLREGLPMVLLEAMASGVPVLATRVGEIPYVIQNGVSGLLVEPKDVDGLTSGMEFLLENPAVASLMAKAGRKIVFERYSAQKMAEETAYIYSKLLGGGYC
ncbi:MAG: glycosyltransferase family 4 protein [Desulfuromonadales bacterium]|nr:glycosyltransferase family 4 protein [Desulfuromonadales bacterium]